MGTTVDYMHLIPECAGLSDTILNATMKHVEAHFPGRNPTTITLAEVEVTGLSNELLQLDVPSDNEEEGTYNVPIMQPNGSSQSIFGNSDSMTAKSIAALFQLLLGPKGIHSSRGVGLIIKHRTIPTTTNVYECTLEDWCGPEDPSSPLPKLPGLRTKLIACGFSYNRPIYLTFTSLHYGNEPNAFRPLLRDSLAFTAAASRSSFTNAGITVNGCGIFEWLLHNPVEACGLPSTTSTATALKRVGAVLRKSLGICFNAGLCQSSCILRGIVRMADVETSRPGASVTSIMARCETSGLLSFKFSELDLRNTIDLKPHTKLIVCFMDNRSNPNRDTVEFENFFDPSNKQRTRAPYLGYQFSAGLAKTTKSRSFRFNPEINATSMFTFKDLDVTKPAKNTGTKRPLEEAGSGPNPCKPLPPPALRHQGLAASGSTTPAPAATSSANTTPGGSGNAGLMPAVPTAPMPNMAALMPFSNLLMAALMQQRPSNEMLMMLQLLNASGSGAQGPTANNQ